MKAAIVGTVLFCTPGVFAASTITVADAALAAAFYADSSCLLTIDSVAQSGKTVIDADVDDVGSRMLIHCDTENGRRLTLLARGDSLNVSQRVPLLNREQISEGAFGMIAWLTRSGVHYADDSVPRRYVIAGSVMLRRSPPVDVAGKALHAERQEFARVSGTLEPILKPDNQAIMQPIAVDTPADDAADDSGQDVDRDTDEQVREPATE